MAARKVSTPGAKTPEPTVETTAQPTTAEQADAALEHITGQDAESQDQSTNETSSLGALVEPTVETTAQPTTAEQADAALEHITGQDAESQDQSTNETSSLG
ncbi:hypothetical protein, partial [Acinetobacter lwoffii]|uniref:hypothetical protein n=1 Tax=Acinetobacter lwoffii TaxID=28090 RepID=UPI003F8DE50A